MDLLLTFSRCRGLNVLGLGGDVQQWHAIPSAVCLCSLIIVPSLVARMELSALIVFSQSHDRTMTKSFIMTCRVRCTLVLPHQAVEEVDSRRAAGAQQQGVQAHLAMHHARYRVVEATTQGKSSKAIQFDTARSQRSSHTALASVKLHGGGELLLVPRERR